MNVKRKLTTYAFEKFWPISFINYISGHLKERFPGEEEELLRKIKARSRKALLEYEETATDEMVSSFIVTCSTIVGSYEVLMERMESQEKVIEFLRHNFKHTAQMRVKLYYRVLLSRYGDKLKAMDDLFRLGIPLYGDSFEYEMVTDLEPDRENVGCHITKCYFHDFFTRYGVAELTTVLCHWDENWLSVIDSKRDGIEYSRPTTLGYGGDKCRFEFRRVAGPDSRAEEVVDDEGSIARDE